MDGLLETTSNNINKLGETTGEGEIRENSYDENQKSNMNDVNNSKESIRSSMDSVKKRRSRSLDDLLDNDSMLVEELDETQSMENLQETSEKNDETFVCSSPTPSEKPCENEVLEILDNSINVKNEHYLNDDSGIQCNSSDNESLININMNNKNNQLTDNEDNVSMSYSVASSDQRDEKSGKNKKFLNKYVSKVKKLMKK